jgi:hypothetical protein
VIWICSFFLMRVTSVFSLVSASTTRALSCSISMLVCLLQHICRQFWTCLHTN